MKTNKIIIMGTVIVIILLILIPTIYRVHKEHEDNLYKVVNEKIIIAAKKCYLDNVCLDDKVTLEFLYEHKYLKKVSDPVTKEYYNPSSYVSKNKEEYIFNVVH